MRLISLSASLGTLLFLAGCGANGTLTPSTASAPTVLGTGLQTNGVATNRQIDVQFSTAMDSSTITPKTFLLAKAGGGTSVPGTVTYDATNFVASFKPSAALDVNTSYAATITTGATSAAGVQFTANYTFAIVTRDSSDTSGITVYETFPNDGQTGVAVNSNIQIVFSEGAASSTVNNQTFVVRDSNYNVIAGTVTYDILTNYATFTPSAPFLPGATYRVVINGVTDLAGEPMPAPQAFVFTTAAVVTQLQDLIYEADVSPGAISGWIYVPSTGSISQVSGSPFPAGLEPVQMVPSPDRETLYVIMGNQPPGIHGANCFDFNTQVFSYAIDHSTGALNEKNRLALNGFCANAGSAIDPTGQFLYVGQSDSTASSGVIDTISLTSGGQMSLATGSPFASPQPITSLALSGNYLYAASNSNSGTDGLLTFQRNPVNGAVQFVSGTALPPQDSIAISAMGTNLYIIGTTTGLITEFQISPGALVQQRTVATSASSFPFHIVPDPQGRYVGVGSHEGTTLYGVDASGTIIGTGSSVIPIDNAPGSVVFDTTGADATVSAESTSGAASALYLYNFPGPGSIQERTQTTGTAHPGTLTMFTN